MTYNLNNRNQNISSELRAMLQSEEFRNVGFRNLNFDGFLIYNFAFQDLQNNSIGNTLETDCDKNVSFVFDIILENTDVEIGHLWLP